MNALTPFYVRWKSDDLGIWNAVLRDDEYRIGELQPKDCVLDIGAHTGSFAVRAWAAGSRHIAAFEVDPDNFALAQQNTSSFPGIYVHNRAVVRSDERKHDPVFYTGHIQMEHEENTGVGTVFGHEGKMARTIAFDDILGSTEIRLVKMDCEGSEFPILYTSRKLAQVQEFVGEWHQNHPLLQAQFGLKPCDLPTLAAHMEAAGFEARFYQRPQDVMPGAIPNPVGNFRFVRRDCLTSASFVRDELDRVRLYEYRP